MELSRFTEYVTMLNRSLRWRHGGPAVGMIYDVVYLPSDESVGSPGPGSGSAHVPSGGSNHVWRDGERPVGRPARGTTTSTWEQTLPTPPHDDPHGGSGQNPGSYDPPPAYWENPGGQGVPPGGYGQDPGGYGQDPGGYGQDPGGQGANPSGYPPPGGAYSQNSAGYGQDPNMYGPPPGGYGNNGGGYNPNASGYGTPPAAFAPPPGGYGYPPGDFGQPPPGAPYGGFGPVPPHMTPIPSYLWQSIVVTLLCCIPAGVVAIVYASKVQSRQQFGDIQGASDASKKARTWCIVSLVLGLLAIAVLIALMAAGVLATEASYEVGTVD